MIISKTFSKAVIMGVILTSSCSADSDSSDNSSIFDFFENTLGEDGGGLVELLLGDNPGLTFLASLNRGYTFPIPGLGSITASCKAPELNIPKLDFCGIEQGLFGEFGTFGTFQPSFQDFGDNPCGVEMVIRDTECGKKWNLDLCRGENSITEKLADLAKFKLGIGGFGQLTANRVKSYGGKELGQTECDRFSTSPSDNSTPSSVGNANGATLSGGGNSISSRDSISSTSTVGSGDSTEVIIESNRGGNSQGNSGDGGGWANSSWSDRVLFDKSIGGDPKYLNTRMAKHFLRCVEVAEENNIDISECSLALKDNIPDFSSAEVENNINTTASTTASSPVPSSPGKLGQNATNYWPLFVKHAKKNGINDPKLLLAIAMQESGEQLNVNAIGENKNSEGKVTSTDWGIMQINDHFHEKPVIEQFPGCGVTLEQCLLVRNSGIGAVDRSIDYGAKVLAACFQEIGDSTQSDWTSVDCYNNGAGGAKKNRDSGYSAQGTDYINGVKEHYANVGGTDLSLQGGDLYETQAATTQSIALFATISEMAVERKRTITHTGQDTLERIPVEHRRAYSQIINRWMSQQTFIEASHKKAADIAKSIIETFSYQSSVMSGDSSTEAATQEEETSESEGEES